MAQNKASSVPTVNLEVTRKMAQLARIELTDEEVRTFTPQLEEVLKYVSLLEQVDLKGVEPMWNPVSQPTPMRTDLATRWPKSVTEAAPEVLDGGFKVPPIL